MLSGCPKAKEVSFSFPAKCIVAMGVPDAATFADILWSKFDRFVLRGIWSRRSDDEDDDIGDMSFDVGLDAWRIFAAVSTPPFLALALRAAVRSARALAFAATSLSILSMSTREYPLAAFLTAPDFFPAHLAAA